MIDIPVTRCGPDKAGNFEYQWADGPLRAHIISDVGRKRNHNEDSVILCAPADTAVSGERGMFFAVADGMGGASAGERASHLALQTAIDQYYSGPLVNIPEHLRESVEVANMIVFREAEDNPALHGMGTTMSALIVQHDCAYIAQVGDSRVYLARGKDECVQVTHDHSLVAEQVRGGIINEEEARNHSLKNLITRAVGIKDLVQVDLFSVRLKRGDTLLICSDGLSNMVRDEEIASCLQMDNLQGAARLLVGKALEAGGDDNISVALVRMEGSPKHAALHDGGTPVHLNATGLVGKMRRLFA